MSNATQAETISYLKALLAMAERGQETVAASAVLGATYNRKTRSSTVRIAVRGDQIIGQIARGTVVLALVAADHGEFQAALEAARGRG